MKKLILLGLVAFICLPIAAYAASIGGAETQGKGKIGVGFDSAFIFGRDLKSKSGTLANGAEVKDIEVTKGYEEMVKVSYGLLDWLDVYAKLGAAKYDSEDNVYVSGVKGYSDKSKAEMGFAWGLGLKAAYPLKNNWLVGCDLQYLMSSHDNKINETNLTTGAVVSTTYKSNVIQEWHIAPYLGYKFGNLVPYLGVRYSDLRAKTKKPSDAGWADNLKSAADNNVGVFVGTDYKIGEHWKLNLEGRFVDEMAMSVGATYRF